MAGSKKKPAKKSAHTAQKAVKKAKPLSLQKRALPARPNPKLLVLEMIRAARASGKVLMHYYTRPLKIREKKGAGLVTQADVESEEASMRLLRKVRPDFEMLTEESSPESRIPPGTRAPYGRWIIDPLDGTTNFVHRYPMFCISIAAEWNGEIIAGVIYHPVLKDMYHAWKGGGAYLNGKRMHVSKTSTLHDSLLTTGFSYRKDEWLHAEMEAFERLSGVARAIRRPGSAALDLAYTARGVFDGFWERRLSPWDVAAGSLLVQEAGGRVTDFSDQPFSVDGDEILATNSKLHLPLLNTIAPELCPI